MKLNGTSTVRSQAREREALATPVTLRLQLASTNSERGEREKHQLPPEFCLLHPHPASHFSSQFLSVLSLHLVASTEGTEKVAAPMVLRASQKYLTVHWVRQVTF